MNKPMASRGISALILLAFAGQALADITPPPFLATNGSRAFTFSATEAPKEFQLAASNEDAPGAYPAISTDFTGRVLVHGINSSGGGTFYQLRGNPSNLWLDPIASTQSAYHSFTYVGERMFGVKNFQGSLDEIVELNPYTFAEVGSFGIFDLGIGGLAYVPNLNEFVVSDTRTNSFYGIAYDGGGDRGSVRLIGHAGMRWGANGLEYHDGVVYGTAIRGEDMQLVFGSVDLDTGHFTVERVLGEAERGAVGFGFVPAPGSVALLGLGGMLAARRRR